MEVYKLVCGKKRDAVHSFSETGIPALYAILASLRCCSQRVPNASNKTLKRNPVRCIHTEGAGGKLEAGDRKARRNDPDLADLDLHAAERKLLVKWDSVPFSKCIFDAILESVAPTASESGPAASASAASSLPSDTPTHHSDGLGKALDKPAEESREKPPGAGSCTGASHTPSLVLASAAAPFPLLAAAA
eukprot:4800994-Pleurochrysis_carterae.AAC.1